MNERFPIYPYDEALIKATRADGRARLRIYPFEERALVLGRGSRAELELFLEVCQREQLPIYRRRGGGCAVFLDPGNLIISLALPADHFRGRPGIFDQISDWLMAGLYRAGVEEIEQDGISDLVLNRRKISGSCLYRSREILFYSATLLIDPDLEMMERCLKHPPREPAYRGGRVHREFVAGLKGLSSVESCAQMAQLLQRELKLSRYSI